MIVVPREDLAIATERLMVALRKATDVQGKRVYLGIYDGHLTPERVAGFLAMITRDVVLIDDTTYFIDVETGNRLGPWPKKQGK